MGEILAVVEQRDGQARGAGREAVSAAAQLADGGAAHALIVGPPGAATAADGLGSAGAEVVHVAEHDAFQQSAPEAMAHVVADHVRGMDYAAVLLSATAQGKDLAPRIAALLDIPLVADVTAIRTEGDAVVGTRPVFAGKALAEVRINASPALLSLRPNAFAASTDAGAAGRVEAFVPSLDGVVPGGRVQGFEAAGAGALDVAEATVVVSGGRGMKDPGNWHLLEALRAALGSDAGLGASRAVVDAGWRPHGEQVGQTGKTVAPKLYFAVGISGAIQHLAGMRTAGTIVAVNKDPDAPIFQVADYGIVGDLFDIVPRLTEEIAALRSDG